MTAHGEESAEAEEEHNNRRSHGEAKSPAWLGFHDLRQNVRANRGEVRVAERRRGAERSEGKRFGGGEAATLLAMVNVRPGSPALFLGSVAAGLENDDLTRFPASQGFLPC